MDLGFSSSLEYDDRVLGGEGDFAVKLRPEIELRDPEGRLQWELEYRPFYEAFLDFSDANGVSHVARAEGTLQIDRRTTFELSDTFRNLSRERLFNEEVTTAEDETVFEARAGTERITQNSFEALLRHLFSPVDTAVLSFRHDLRDRPDGELGDLEGELDRRGGGASDRTNLSLSAQYLRSVSARTTLGVSLSATRSEVSRGGREESQTDFFNLSGSWQYQPDETLNMSFSIGPTLVTSDPSDRQLQAITVQRFPLAESGSLLDVTTCPVTEAGRPFLSAECEEIGFTVPGIGQLRTVAMPIGEVPSASDTNVSFFANGSIAKSWGAWSASLRYRRRESSSSGRLGSSAISDVVAGSLRWEPKGRWRAFLNAQWNRRTSAAESVAPVLVLQPDTIGIAGDVAEVAGVSVTRLDRDFERSVLTASMEGRYRLTRKVELFARAFFANQRSEFESASREIDSMRLTVGVAYEFDPIRF